MEFFKKRTEIDFLGKRRISLVISVIAIIITLVSIFTRGFNFGLDFTGGTLVEVAYDKPVEVRDIREQLVTAGYNDAVVQHFGTIQDILIRLPVSEDRDAAKLSNDVVIKLREAVGETGIPSETGTQQCKQGEKVVACAVQVRRVEFVGPQVGGELAYKGGLALVYTLLAILVYVTFRFRWYFSLGAVVATMHDVLLVFGFFSITQMEFDLTVLAALLAVLGYSLNDTIVVFDRIRENFRKLRGMNEVDTMNRSINDTLSRTIITSGTTLLALVALFVFGGEIIHAFSVALIVGIVVGTYSSIYIATPMVLALGITREDMLPPEKEGKEGAGQDIHTL